MADLMEVTLAWSAPNTRSGTSVLHFNADDPSPVRAALFGALDEISSLINSLASVTIANEGRFFDDATGTLTGQWADSDPGTIQGAGAGDPVPNASQALLRLNTTGIVNGRFVRGRTFIPSIISEATDNGELTAAARLELATAFDAAYLAATQQVVWARPVTVATESVAVRPGSSYSVTDVSVWNELAVLRRRR